MLNIFNIQRFSTHDGEGIRTNIFFKGCPLKCPWCSNPESRATKPNLLYDKRLCHRFEECVKASDGGLYFEQDQLMIDQNAIVDVEILKDICPAKALSVVGERKSIDEIVDAVEKDLPFYSQSEGGVTLTGGEPFAQNLNLLSLVKELKARGIDIAVETSLHMPWIRIEPYVELIDQWLVDLKHVDPDKFKKFTGGSAELIMSNFRKLDAANVNMIVRVPVIPGFNHAHSEMQHIINFAASLQSLREIHFMPYHILGKGKYDLMGIDYQYNNYQSVSSDELDDITNYTKLKNLKFKIGG